MENQAEIDALLAAEPAWSVVSVLPEGTVLEGPAVIEGSTGKEYHFALRIEVPRTFPDESAHPVVTVVSGPIQLTEDVHASADTKALCIHMPPAREIDYAEVGLVGFLNQVLIHLRRMVIQSLTGQFPGRVYAHGDAGKAQFRKELVEGFPPGLKRFVQPGSGMPPDNQRCPCGSGRRLQDCHKLALKRARRAFLEAGGQVRLSVRDRLKRK